MLESLRTNPLAVIQTPEISGIQETEIPQAQFLQTISKVTLKNGIQLLNSLLRISPLIQSP